MKSIRVTTHADLFRALQRFMEAQVERLEHSMMRLHSVKGVIQNDIDLDKEGYEKWKKSVKWALEDMAEFHKRAMTMDREVLKAYIAKIDEHISRCAKGLEPLELNPPLPSFYEDGKEPEGFDPNDDVPF